MARTQDALYAEIDLELSWSESELPERERTKHVNRLHPYLGKFVPQLVETLLGRYVRAGGRVVDPFAGSGTTLVQSLESGYDATGVDVAAFNCLLIRVKTARYNEFVLESELRDALSRLATARSQTQGHGYIGRWFAPDGILRISEARLRFFGRPRRSRGDPCAPIVYGMTSTEHKGDARCNHEARHDDGRVDRLVYGHSSERNRDERIHVGVRADARGRRPAEQEHVRRKCQDRSEQDQIAQREQ